MHLWRKVPKKASFDDEILKELFVCATFHILDIS